MDLASKEAINQFKALMDQVDEPLKKTFENVHQGYVVKTLERFLKAKEGNVSKAHKMLVEILQWRLQNGIDDILNRIDDTLAASSFINHRHLKLLTGHSDYAREVIKLSFNSQDGVYVVSGYSLAECAANAGSCKKVAAVGINCTPPRSTDDTIRNSDLDETPSEIGGYQHRSMGQQNDGPALGPLRVVDLDQCTSEAKVILKMEKSAAGEYLVWSEEQRKFKILPCDTRLHRKLVQLDENGRQVAMLKAKNITTHDRWLGYSCRGESKADRKKEFSMYRDHTDLHVTLETSSSNAVDFKVSVNRTAKTCTIYKGDSSTVMAQTHQVGNEDSILVEVYPNVDCAFVALLIVIVDAMNSPGKLRVVAGRAAKLTRKFVGGAILVAGQFVANAIIC